MSDDAAPVSPESATVAEAAEPSDVAAPPSPTDTPAEAAAKRSYRLKIDGKEEVFEGTDDDIVRELQIGRAGKKRFEEAAKMRQEAEHRYKLLKDDPEAALKAAGVDVEDFIASRLVEEYKRAAMSEEQRKAADLQRERDEYRTKAQKLEESQQMAALERQADLMWQQMEPEFVAAIEVHPNLPRTQSTLRDVANVSLEFLEAGIDLTPAQIVREVARRHEATHLSWLRGPDAEAARLSWLREADAASLRKMLTPEQLKALVDSGAIDAADAGKLRVGAPKSNKQKTSKPTAKSDRISPDDFLSSLRRGG